MAQSKMALAESIPGVRHLSPVSDHASSTNAWSLDELAGRLCELSGEASLTMAMSLVHAAQRAAEPVVWITDDQRMFFAPDVDEGGVDLSSLVVAFMPDANAKARAADQFARSGAFGLIVLDLGARARIAMPLLSRLLGLAQKHHIAILFLAEKDASLGSLISLRAEAHRSHPSPGEFVCELRAIKDKRRTPFWKTREVHRGPTGLY